MGLHDFYINKEEKNIRFDLVIIIEKGDRRNYHTTALELIRNHYPDYNIYVGMDLGYNELEM